MTVFKHIDFEAPDFGEFAQGPAVMRAFVPGPDDFAAYTVGVSLEDTGDWVLAWGDAGTAEVSNASGANLPTTTPFVGLVDADKAAVYRRVGDVPLVDQFSSLAQGSSSPAIGADKYEQPLVGVRVPASGAGGYFALLQAAFFGQHFVFLYRMEADGSLTELASELAVAGGSMPQRIEAEGSTIRIKGANGSAVLTHTDSTYAAGFPGFYATTTHTGAGIVRGFDDWNGGAL